MKNLVVVMICAFVLLSSSQIITKELYGTYKIMDAHKGACLSLLTLKKDNSFKYKQTLHLEKQDTIIGNWYSMGDTLFLDYDRKSENICLKDMLQIIVEDGKVELNTFHTDKSICGDCNSFRKVRDY